MWQEYENQGWPARYLFDGRARCSTTTTARARTRRPSSRSRSCWASSASRWPAAPRGAPGAQLVAQTEDQPGAYSGPYEAGGVWAVLDGEGTVRSARGTRRRVELTVAHPGAYPLIEHERHTDGRARPGDRRGRGLPRDLLHPRRRAASAATAPRAAGEPSAGAGRAARGCGRRAAAAAAADRRPRRARAHPGQ